MLDLDISDHVEKIAQNISFFIETQSKEISNLKDAKELLVKLLVFKKNNKMIMTSNNLKD